MAAIYPPYNDYQARTEREIPVVILDLDQFGGVLCLDGLVQ